VALPQVILDGVRKLSDEFGVQFSVERHWENEFGTGYYCRVHGCVHASVNLRIELVGSLAIGTHDDHLDLFIVANGIRVSPMTQPLRYLHRGTAGQLRWDSLDEGYEVQTTLDVLLLRQKS
jgi:hypothetical protein